MRELLERLARDYDQAKAERDAQAAREAAGS